MSRNLRMSVEEYEKRQKAGKVTVTKFPDGIPAMQKYGNVPTDGYHSKGEAKRAEKLRMLQHLGEISELREQVKYLLLPSQRRDDGKMERELYYVADFVYRQHGKEIVEDFKGYRTPDYKIKRKLMLWVHNITILETK